MNQMRDGYVCMARAMFRGLQLPPPGNALKMFRLRQAVKLADVAIAVGQFDLVEGHLSKTLADIPDRYRNKVYRLVVPAHVRDALRGPSIFETAARTARILSGAPEGSPAAGRQIGDLL